MDNAGIVYGHSENLKLQLLLHSEMHFLQLSIIFKHLNNRCQYNKINILKITISTTTTRRFAKILDHNCSYYSIIQYLEVQFPKIVFWCTQRTKWASSIPSPHILSPEIQSLIWVPFSRDKRTALTMMCPSFLLFIINYHIYILMLSYARGY